MPFEPEGWARYFPTFDELLELSFEDDPEYIPVASDDWNPLDELSLI